MQFKLCFDTLETAFSPMALESANSIFRVEHLSQPLLESRELQLHLDSRLHTYNTPTLSTFPDQPLRCRHSPTSLYAVDFPGLPPRCRRPRTVVTDLQANSHAVINVPRTAVKDVLRTTLSLIPRTVPADLQHANEDPFYFKFHKQVILSEFLSPTSVWKDLHASEVYIVLSLVLTFFGPFEAKHQV
ncbi:hypothetical protein JTE90_016652 [Oedothorax gibbosus]|uniref:Uncharacterized protein n=1 Tax=Oedothorax gibbosus TaxID=931172 RepID=A0AAV6V3Z3_9ARAC|nr:hypothetical protein JTE90_016652 [Oedothorax gibbosus]